jgi:hypothetical protein
MIYLTIDPPADEPTTEEAAGTEAPTEGAGEPATGSDEQPAA